MSLHDALSQGLGVSREELSPVQAAVLLAQARNLPGGAGARVRIEAAVRARNWTPTELEAGVRAATHEGLLRGGALTGTGQLAARLAAQAAGL
jgi:hypothetical protein